MANNKDPIKLKCKHCKYIWDYKGSAKYYACCPQCHYNVNIKKQKVEEDKEQVDI